MTWIALGLIAAILLIAYGLKRLNGLSGPTVLADTGTTPGPGGCASRGSAEPVRKRLGFLDGMGPAHFNLLLHAAFGAFTFICGVLAGFIIALVVVVIPS